MNATTQYLRANEEPQRIEIPKLLGCILQDAVQAGASDIHLEPWEDTLAVRIRLDGVLTELVHLPPELLEKPSARCKVMANLVSYHPDLPHEGHVPTNP